MSDKLRAQKHSLPVGLRQPVCILANSLGVNVLFPVNTEAQLICMN